MHSLLNGSTRGRFFHIRYSQLSYSASNQGLDPLAYEAQKEEVASNVIERLDKVFPGLKDGVVFK